MSRRTFSFQAPDGSLLVTPRTPSSKHKSEEEQRAKRFKAAITAPTKFFCDLCKKEYAVDPEYGLALSGLLHHCDCVVWEPARTHLGDIPIGLHIDLEKRTYVHHIVSGVEPAIWEDMLRIMKKPGFWFNNLTTMGGCQQERFVGWQKSTNRPYKGTAAVKAMPEFKRLVAALPHLDAVKAAESVYCEMKFENAFPKLTTAPPNLWGISRNRFGADVIFTKNPQAAMLTTINVDFGGNRVHGTGGHILPNGRVSRVLGQHVAEGNSSHTIGLFFQKPVTGCNAAFFNIGPYTYPMANGIVAVYDGSTASHGAWSQIMDHVTEEATWYSILFVNNKMQT